MGKQGRRSRSHFVIYAIAMTIQAILRRENHAKSTARNAQLTFTRVLATKTVLAFGNFPSAGRGGTSDFYKLLAAIIHRVTTLGLIVMARSKRTHANGASRNTLFAHAVYAMQKRQSGRRKIL